MFWKIASVLSVFGIIFGIIIFFFAYRTLNATNDSNTETIALIGIIGGILLTIFSFLLLFISVIFILRNSKKDFDAKNVK